MDWLQFNTDFNSDFARSKTGRTRLVKMIVKSLQQTSDDQDAHTQTAAVAIRSLQLVGLSSIAKECATILLQAKSSNHKQNTFRTYGLANYYAAVKCDYAKAGTLLRDYDPLPSSPADHDELAIRCAIYWRRAIAEQVAGSPDYAEKSLSKARAFADETADGTMLQITHRGASALRYMQDNPRQALDEAIKGLFFVEKVRPSAKLINTELLMMMCLVQIKDMHLLGWRVLDLWQSLLRCSIEMPGYADALYFRSMAPSPRQRLAKVTHQEILESPSRKWPTPVREQMREIREQGCMREIREQGCTSCGAMEPLDLDHVIPYSWGGTSTLLNARWLCQRCNRARRDYFGWDPYAYFWLSRGIDLAIDFSTFKKSPGHGLRVPAPVQS